MKDRIKRAILALMFVLTICVTAKTTEVLLEQNREYEQAVSTIISDEQEADPVEQFRTERQQLRQMQKNQLNDIIYNGNSDAEIIQLARRQMLEMIQTEEMEFTLEGILKMRGWDDAIVTVNGDSVNVIVRSSVLTQQQSAVILDLVMRETSISGGNVKIIPIN